MSTYNEIYSQVENLTPEEQLRLLEELAVLVRQRVISQHHTSSKKFDRWFGFLPERIDALEFQLQLRREWDE
ncbi:MAG: hypothetical protein KME60_00895 [Cyanomargarita calcarea GSE-NOS-MK-12-04C]|jgi:hypothetical protein|uniref:Uncharacterized protein n=1 Tax=Cyanomargarita calcarea GSE-NOS-MK-12-04C TaxID=2839659 RepID=A0A951QGI3_9CYAN|nr:hypothetical protein [Cyanomargarita calcarea GSE-NOS-MK-12-04C]